MEEYLDFGGITDRKTIAILGGYFKDKRYDYTSGNLDYVGFHFKHDADSGSEDWEIWKLTWSAGDKLREEGPLKGSWANRNSLPWSPEGIVSRSDKGGDAPVGSLIQEVLKELKIMKLHLMILTDHEITEQEIS